MVGLAELQISTLLGNCLDKNTQFCGNYLSSEGAYSKQAMLRNVKELIQGNDVLEFNGDGSKLVTCLITDSRRVVPGALFFAIEGERHNGNYYIEEAVDRGAVAIISEQSASEYLPIDYIQVENVGTNAMTNRSSQHASSKETESCSQYQSTLTLKSHLICKEWMTVYSRICGLNAIIAEK